MRTEYHQLVKSMSECLKKEKPLKYSVAEEEKDKEYSHEIVKDVLPYAITGLINDSKTAKGLRFEMERRGRKKEVYTK